MTGTTTGLLINAPAPTTIFYSIIEKIPGMYDYVYNALSQPIVRGMILLLVVCLFIFKTK